MITITTGNIFDTSADFITIPVNTRGVMGAGLAKEMKRRFPVESQAYIDACAEKIFTTKTILRVDPQTSRFGFFFAPTKDDWRSPSTFTGIAAISERLLGAFEALPPTIAVALPALGCGCGGLPWNVVKGHLLTIFSESTRTLFIYEPT